MIKTTAILAEEALKLLKQLVAVPSLSRQESGTAALLEKFFAERSIEHFRVKNNVWAVNKFFDPGKPGILLNSHHDTVAANARYTIDPYQPIVLDGKLYGLGTTDAGASLCSLIAAFLHFYDMPALRYNIVLAASAEEEISGTNGIDLLFRQKNFSELFTHPDSFAIVGEPTELQLAIAEKGLLVLDCVAHGKAGHAARDEGENALYKAMDAINWFRHYKFDKLSATLGEVKMTVTSVETDNKAHNVIPASCSFVVDIRVTDAYTHEAILGIIREHVEVDVQPRSTRLRSSSIDEHHPLVQAGLALGKLTYGSPTTSDQALINLPSLKCGPGFSGQSHSADEYIDLKWIPEAVEFYIHLLEKTLEAGTEPA
ncbi:MAG: M20/M25/M40 family metallo-hydrolase [Chitinophagaceae bacterium]|nr:MAG: M20/M25/M40 family metallo-hydrolase [Chitinophagaceae bacterium]